MPFDEEEEDPELRDVGDRRDDVDVLLSPPLFLLPTSPMEMMTLLPLLVMDSSREFFL